MKNHIIKVLTITATIVTVLLAVGCVDRHRLSKEPLNDTSYPVTVVGKERYAGSNGLLSFLVLRNETGEKYTVRVSSYFYDNTDEGTVLYISTVQSTRIVYEWDLE